MPRRITVPSVASPKQPLRAVIRHSHGGRFGAHLVDVSLDLFRVLAGPSRSTRMERWAAWGVRRRDGGAGPAPAHPGAERLPGHAWPPAALALAAPARPRPGCGSAPGGRPHLAPAPAVQIED